MEKPYLLTPGPTPIPEVVSSAFLLPLIHHRTPEFKNLLDEIRMGLKYLYQTQQEVLLLTATGTGAMDAAVCNLFNSGDTVITVNGGKFGERWTKIAQAYQLIPVEIVIEPGQTLKSTQLSEVIGSHPHAKGVLFQSIETSTGVEMPTEVICQLARQAGMLSVCDAIAACGVLNLPMDQWGIDVVISGSQKALMTPPGLSMIALSQQAWEMQKKSKLPRFYFDLEKERIMQTQNQTAWTPAVSLFQGLKKSLELIKEEGLQAVFKRHSLLGKATRHAIQALGLELLAQESPSPAVTVIKIPASLSNGKQISKLMRDKYGVVITGGQAGGDQEMIRFAHMGYCHCFDIVVGISALELVLNDLGFSIEFGKGVGMVLSTFAEG